MAKNLSKTGITTTETIEAWHVTQSIDAFTGADAYNINLSGSLEVTGSITGTPGIVNELTSSHAVSSSYATQALSASYVTSASYATQALSASYAVSASVEIQKEVSSSHAENADTASYVEAVNINQPFLNITASGDISASKNLFISTSLNPIQANMMAVDTSSGLVYHTPFPIKATGGGGGGGSSIGNTTSTMDIEGSAVTITSTGNSNIVAAQTNFKKADGTTMAFINNTTGDAKFGLSSVNINANGEITASGTITIGATASHNTIYENSLDGLGLYSKEKAEITSEGGLNMKIDNGLSFETYGGSNLFGIESTYIKSYKEFNMNSNRIFGVSSITSSGDISSSATVYANKAVFPDNLTLTGNSGFGYIKFGINQDQFIAGTDDQIIIDGDSTIRLQASTGISLAVPGIGNSAIPGGTNVVLTGSITLANGSAYSGSITTEGYITASAFSGNNIEISGTGSIAYLEPTETFVNYITFCHNFGASAAPSFYLPWSDSTEATSTSTKAAFQVPYSMSLHKIVFSNENITGGGQDIIFELVKEANGTGTITTLATSSVTSLTEPGDDKTAFTLNANDFNNQVSFSYPDKCRMVISSSVNFVSSTDVFVTSIWKQTVKI